MDVPPCVDRRFSVVVKEHDDIFHIGRNKCLEIITVWKCLCIIEDKSCRRYSLSGEYHLPLKFEKSAMKISKL